MKRIFLFSCLFMTAAPVAAQPTPPNIIIVLADDMGYGDIQGFGAKYATPNFAALQREGMKLTSFYSQPQCSPSRAALMTGCYPQRVGIPWVVGPEGPEWTRDKSYIGLNADEQTLPEILKEKQYATACIGKWHLGHHAQHLPTQHGFDEYFGLPYSNDMWPQNTAGGFPPLPLIEGDKVIEEDPDQTQLTRRYTERAVAFISQHRSSPFFLYVAHNMPHVPIFASNKFKDKSGRGLYTDVIQELDWSVGEIMKALKSNGIDKNTLLIFTSDNGPWLVYGDHGGSSGGLREGKNTTFEGGVRVPFIARWPGHIKGGSASAAPAALIDLLPTLTDLVKGELPTRQIDGKSMLPLLLGNSKEPPRDVHYYLQINNLQAVRKGKWKLHFAHPYDHITKAGLHGDRGEMSTAQLELSLFDLEADRAELRNVAASHPEIVAELKQLGEKFKASLELEARKPGTSK